MQIPPKTPATAPSLSIGDIYYALFRHKWRILICAIAGFAAAAAVYRLNPAPYSSEAKLFIRYVVIEGRAPTPGDDSRMKSPDMRGETIMDSEEEILTSLDLSKQVAEAVGPEKILAKIDGGRDLGAAARVINRGLVVEAPPKSSVIRIVYNHPDFTVVQPVLREVIDRYLKMHVDIHRAVGIMGDVLIQETDQLKNRLAQTEEDLRKVRNKAGVISIGDTKTALSGQLTHLQDELFTVEAELAERTALYNELTGHSTLSPSATTEVPTPPAKALEYRTIVSRLTLLQQREQALLSQFTEENSRVKNIRTQIEDAERQKSELEAAFPLLSRLPSGTDGTKSNAATIDPAVESARLNALRAKIKVINSQMDLIRSQALAIDQIEGTVSELTRKKELEETNYKYYATSLEQSRINEALGAGKVSNISQIESPTPPYVDNKRTMKLVAGIAVGGVLLGLAWSFLIELYLDRSIRRPIDVERLLSIPLFLTIPTIGKTGKHRRLGNANKPLELVQSKGNGSLIPTQTEIAGTGSGFSEENSLVLHTFHETLRDRLISYFESVNLTHKPKLVAVTGLGCNSGVTTTAAGLARSLSETGEGNVLLVDMTAGQGSAQQFYRGKDVVGLEDILSTRDEAQVQDKLYVVAEEPGREKLSRILPQRFTKLVPKLKASNFDYIIFDMPAISQISITPRLAGFMDMVLMVIESEKTDRELVQRATSLLAQSNAHVGAVLNKARSYVPAALHQEYLGNS
jgi:polysaccharide biosynthesis transport protein